MSARLPSPLRRDTGASARALEVARRNRAWIGIVTVVAVVAVFFPGRQPLPTRPLGSGSFADGSSSPVAEVGGVTVERGEVAVPGGAGSTATPGSEAGLVVSVPARAGGRVGERDGMGDRGGVGRRSSPGEGGTGEGGTGEGGSPAPPPSECRAAAVAGPVRSAQEALEQRMGRPLPVKLADLLCPGSAAGTTAAELLVLAEVTPLRDRGLVARLAPVLVPVCEAFVGGFLRGAGALGLHLEGAGKALALCRAGAVGNGGPGLRGGPVARIPGRPGKPWTPVPLAVLLALGGE